jgi:3-isopropylmalate/(R)-2-methylmalate dehydratase large subunit
LKLIIQIKNFESTIFLFCKKKSQTKNLKFLILNFLNLKSKITSMAKTLYDKIWDSHLVYDDGASAAIYVDRQLIHEVTSPQAFEALRLKKRKPRRPEAHLAVADHNVPTTTADRHHGTSGIKDKTSRIQVETLEKNCREFGIKYFDLDDKKQGIVHIVGPEQGLTQPGMVIVCGGFWDWNFRS